MRVPVNLLQGRDSVLRGRRLTAYEQGVERLAQSRAGAWAFLHVFSPVDRRVLALTRGRVSLAVGAPVALLETVGARTGSLRRTPLLYVIDGDAVVVVASNGGRNRHPAWLHNLRECDAVRLLTPEWGWQGYRARVATGTERTRRWALAGDLFAGYDRYQARAGTRELAVVVLEAAQRGMEIPPAT